MSLGDGGCSWNLMIRHITVSSLLYLTYFNTSTKLKNPIKMSLTKLKLILNFRKLSADEVFKTLKTIDAWSKATGAEGIPAAGPCSRLLTPLINLSSKSGVFPDRLKIARITPIFKGRVKFDRENYRPISILPVVSKIHEQLVNEQLQSYASLITKEQFEYSKNSSTIALLLKVVDEW